MKTYFISDTHFEHKKIIQYCDRPFSSIEEMNNTLIKNWNSVVSNEDTVWFLGDFALTNMVRIRELVSKLNGNKKLIIGNHDRHKIKDYYNAGFVYVSKYPIVLKKKFILSHAPIEQSKDSGYINIYGHVHNGPSLVNDENICVCVEHINYTPREIKVFNES